MAGDNERFSRHSPLWRKIAAQLGSLDTADELSNKLTLDGLYQTFFRSRNEIKNTEYYEKALLAFSETDSVKLQKLLHETRGNQLVRILNEACFIPEQPKKAIQRIIQQHVENLFRSIIAQARVDSERYMRTKGRLDAARDSVPAIAESLANQLLDNPHGRWKKPKAKKLELSESLL